MADDRAANFPNAGASLGGTERALIEAVQLGDSRAAAPLYDYLRQSIDTGLLRTLHSKPNDYEDLVQMCFERVVRSLAEDRFQGNSCLRTWAHAIARNVAMDWVRGHRRAQQVFETCDPQMLSEVPEDRLPERQLEARSEMRRVHQVLGRMRRLNAMAILLHDVHEHPVWEVAEMLDLGVSATASRLRRGRLEFARRTATSIAPTAS